MHETTFNDLSVGDEVVIIKTLGAKMKANFEEEGHHIVEEMVAMAGEIKKVTEIYDGCYMMIKLNDGTGCGYTPGMIRTIRDTDVI